MGYNKIPLALGFNDSTGNASGLVEFTLNLSDVGDACSASPVIGQALVYNEDGQWCPSSLPAPGAFEGNLSDVGEVCTDPPNEGESLVWNGSSWCGSAITGGGGGAVNSVNDLTGDVSLYLSSLSGMNFTSLSAHQHIEYDADNNVWINTYNDQVFIEVYNGNGFELTEGTVVYVSGVQGAETPRVALARANSTDTMPSFGIIKGSIPINERGLAVTFGTADSVSFDVTPTGNIGKAVYVSPDTAGAVTLTKPDGANELIQNVGILVKDGASPKVKVTGVGRSNDIPVNVDVVGSATIGTNNVFTQTDAQLDGTTASELVLTDSNNKIGSVASSTLFTQGIADNNIATTPIPDGDLASTFIKTDASTVNPTNLSGTIADGELVKRTDANQFVGVTTTTDSETFLGTNANLENTTNVATGVTDADILQYDTVTNKWEPRSLDEVQTNSAAAGRIDLGGLGNVNDSDDPPATDITEYQALVYDTVNEDYRVQTLEHDNLSGLGDDDHTQYVLSAGTREMATLTVTGATNLSGTLNVQPSGWGQMSGSPVPVVYHREVGYPIASSNFEGAAPGDELVAITIPASTLTYYEVDIMCRGRVRPDGQNIRLTTELDGNTVLFGGAGAGNGTGYGLAKYQWQISWTKYAADEQTIFMNWIQSGDVSSFITGGGVGGLNSRQTHGVIWNETSHTESNSAVISLNFAQTTAGSSLGYFTIDSIVVKFIPLHAMNTA